MGWSALKFYLWRCVHKLSKVGEDEMFGPVMEPGLEYPSGLWRTLPPLMLEGGGFDRNVIMTPSVHCGIWKAPLSPLLFKVSLVFPDFGKFSDFGMAVLAMGKNGGC